MNTELQAAIEQGNREVAIRLISEMDMLSGKNPETGAVDTSEAEDVMFYILDCARSEAYRHIHQLKNREIGRSEYESHLNVYADLLRALFEQFPTLNINRAAVFGRNYLFETTRPTGFRYRNEDLWRAYRGIPLGLNHALPHIIHFEGQGSNGSVDLWELQHTYVSPILLCMLYDMETIMDLLLSQPQLDTAVGDYDRRFSRSSYDWAHLRDKLLCPFDGSEIVENDGSVQFIFKDFITKRTEKKIVLHHLFTHPGETQFPTQITPAEIRELMFEKIMKEVNAANSPERQLQLLLNAMGPSYIPVDSALFKFLGEKKPFSGKSELDLLNESLHAQVHRVMASRPPLPADPTTVPVTTTSSSSTGASVNADPGLPKDEENKGGIFSKFFAKN